MAVFKERRRLLTMAPGKEVDFDQTVGTKRHTHKGLMPKPRNAEEANYNARSWPELGGTLIEHIKLFDFLETQGRPTTALYYR